MAASEAFIVQGEDSPTTASPVTVASGPVAASPRWPQLIPIAQLLAVVLGVFAIIWNQQQTIGSLRTELTADINRVETTLTADINRVETGLDELRTELTAEINRVETGLRTELGGAIEELHAEVSNNGQRLARIEGFLGIGMPDEAPMSPE